MSAACAASPAVSHDIVRAGAGVSGGVVLLSTRLDQDRDNRGGRERSFHLTLRIGLGGLLRRRELSLCWRGLAIAIRLSRAGEAGWRLNDRTISCLRSCARRACSFGWDRCKRDRLARGDLRVEGGGGRSRAMIGRTVPPDRIRHQGRKPQKNEDNPRFHGVIQPEEVIPSSSRDRRGWILDCLGKGADRRSHGR
jgi:hypothetical protein